jgi:hypothetical protein
MNSEDKLYTGRCLCGALRYEAVGESTGSGHCYCGDCRRASGSGFVPFMGFTADSVRFTGEARQFHSKAARNHTHVGSGFARSRRRVLLKTSAF